MVFTGILMDPEEHSESQEYSDSKENSDSEDGSEEHSNSKDGSQGHSDSEDGFEDHSDSEKRSSSKDMEVDEAVAKGGANIGSYGGYLVRARVRITITNWKDVSPTLKKNLWISLKFVFIVAAALCIPCQSFSAAALCIHAQVCHCLIMITEFKGYVTEIVCENVTK
ncbi:hypothetical protein IFM89_006695 [Coptis chinensis]|uniref:Uncharacterized protein n=1 Tax=Coptis chinensis TaxID=261450 RepID=A0A835IYN5_9MAGN|nr:hypothetical protein IFM89_006695 [Coptis chinensis]